MKAERVDREIKQKDELIKWAKKEIQEYKTFIKMLENNK